MSKFFKVLLPLLVVVLLLISCSKTSSTDTATTTATTTAAQQTTADKSQSLTVKDSGYSVVESEEGYNIYYSLEISNSSSKTAQFPVITITAKDDSGKVLTSEDQTITSIAAGDTIKYANAIGYSGDKASTVDLSVNVGAEDYVESDDTVLAKSSVFAVSDTKLTKADGDINITGNIKNNSDNDYDTVAVSAVFYKDGKMVGGLTNFVDDLEYGSTQPFEIDYISGDLQYDDYEVFAFVWC